MKIEIVVAASLNNAIGKNNTLPWHLPADLKHFKNLTWGLPIVMGKNTWYSLGKALPGRENIVLTNTGFSEKPLGAHVMSSFDESVNWAKENKFNKLMIIGGAQIYSSLLPLADKIHLTRVHTNIEGDVFFPELDNSWVCIDKIENKADEKNKFNYDFETWVKANNN